MVEHLRQAHGIGGALADFKVDDAECVVTFKGPGYAADAFIDRETGHYTVTQSYHGVVAILNDLHKGRDTGPAWSILIDASAILLTLISATGLVLLFYLKLRRVPGLIVVDCRDDLRPCALSLGGPVRTTGPCPGTVFRCRCRRGESQHEEITQA